MFDLNGKNAYVTGAAGGIGLAVAKRFHHAGAKVVITDVTDASQVAKEIDAIFHRVDVSDEEHVAESLARAEEQLGKLDIVVNNAGIGEVGHTLEESEQSFIERKAAVVSMTAMSALELGSRGIRVNAVCPGYIATALGSGDEGVDLCEAMTALGRVGTTEDLTGLYHYLASDESSYLTGQALKVDGGWSCGPSSAVLEKILGRPKVS